MLPGSGAVLRKLILMGTSGIMTLVLSGAVPMLLAGTVPDFSGLIPRMAHGVMSRILLALLVAHVGAVAAGVFICKRRFSHRELHKPQWTIAGSTRRPGR